MSEIRDLLEKIHNGLQFATKLVPMLKEIEYITLHAEVLLDDADGNMRVLNKVMKGRNKKREVITRNTVRSSCACIEGFSYVLKTALKSTIEQTPPNTFSKKQIEFLEKNETNGSGAEIYKLALKCFAKKYNVDISNVFGTGDFDKLRELFELRNRLMHPKNANDLNVDFDDMILLSSSMKWFIDSHHQVFRQVMESIEQQMNELCLEEEI
ncbi:hypothetical protein [Vibrio metschnikovii]|uniref:hypothetical protein n=1 Tax=Vibrio metschnikovii TaxID=28172 RepID=UPI001C3094D5|nr:hypothetical protein [Vibrio metschnikovii]